MTRLLFVCTANLCRSPIAEAVFNVLAEEGGLNFWAESAGVAAQEGRPMTPEAVSVLEEIGGVRARTHQSRRLKQTTLDGADLVLTMSPGHVAKIRREFGNFAPEVHVLPGYVGATGEEEVPDPYGRSMAVYRATAYQIFGYVDLLVKRLGRKECDVKPASN